MKNFKVILMALSMVVSSAAFAGEVGTASDSPSSQGVAVTPAELLITTTAIILTHDHHHKALYIAAQEDAALFVATEGEMGQSAVLADALAQAGSIQNLSDLDLARAILLVK